MEQPQPVRVEILLDPPGSATNVTATERIEIAVRQGERELSMDAGLAILQRATNYVLFSLIRNTILRDLKREAQAQRIVLPTGVQGPTR